MLASTDTGETFEVTFEAALDVGTAWYWASGIPAALQAPRTYFHVQDDLHCTTMAVCEVLKDRSVRRNDKGAVLCQISVMINKKALESFKRQDEELR